MTRWGDVHFEDQMFSAEELGLSGLALSCPDFFCTTYIGYSGRVVWVRHVATISRTVEIPADLSYEDRMVIYRKLASELMTEAEVLKAMGL